MVHVARPVDVLQLRVGGQLLDRVGVVRVRGAAVLEMQDVGTTLLVDYDAWVIVFAHDDLVLRLQLDVVLRVEVLLAVRAALVRLRLVHQTLAAALDVLAAAFLE